LGVRRSVVAAQSGQRCDEGKPLASPQHARSATTESVDSALIALEALEPSASTSRVYTRAESSLFETGFRLRSFFVAASLIDAASAWASLARASSPRVLELASCAGS